ncbi:MAG: hypothetical protein Q9160_000576 [Pyrenula sp. 1 TL-2023]
MQFRSTLAIAGLLGLAAAIPAPAANGYPEGTTVTKVSGDEVKAALSGQGIHTNAVSGPDTGIYMCTDKDFNTSTGNCYHVTAPSGLCLTGGPELQDNISSVGADQGYNCNLYVDSQCAGSTFNVGTPGYFDLSKDLGGAFNDKISSWRCFTN